MTKKIILLFLIIFYQLFAIDIEINQTKVDNSQIDKTSKAYFGESLFQGNFKDNLQYRYNPDYVINVGDIISVKLWGAYNFSAELPVDKQGNIFIPKVGEVHLLGVPNRDLKKKIEQAVRRVFNSSVYTYADLKQYQPISVFVSGSVKKVGLYKGLSTDSILQFIDKAGGIIRGQGSYRDVSILRDKQVIKRVDLYQFLLDGQIDMFQFKNGDVILVNPVHNFVEIDGDVNRPYIFEILNDNTTVADIMKFIMPKPTANRFMITKWENGEEITKDYPLSEAGSQYVTKGTKIRFFSDYYVNNIEIQIEGEHKGVKKLTVKKGTTLYDVLSQVKFTPLSDIKNIRLYRKSVANTQKQLIDTMLKEC